MRSSSSSVPKQRPRPQPADAHSGAASAKSAEGAAAEQLSVLLQLKAEHTDAQHSRLAGLSAALSRWQGVCSQYEQHAHAVDDELRHAREQIVSTPCAQHICMP